MKPAVQSLPGRKHRAGTGLRMLLKALRPDSRGDRGGLL